MPLPTTRQKLESCIKTMHRNNFVFMVKRKRENASIVYQNKTTMYYRKPQKSYGNVTAQDSLVLVGLVAKSVNAYIKRNNFVVEEVKQVHKANYTNHDLWMDMPIGSVFFYVDINHCYWRIAWLYTYIGDKLYHKYANKPGYKTHLSRALACIIAPEVRDYYWPNNITWRIQEDRSLHERIHKNIRHTCWNLMGELAELLNYQCIGYRTDGIMVPRHLVASVKDYLDSNNFLFSVRKCVKVSDKFYKVHPMHFHYPEDSKLRPF